MHIATSIVLLAATAHLAIADFFFGVRAGEMVDGIWNHPTTDSYTTEILMLGSQSICDAAPFDGNPSTPSTVPSDPWINWCGQNIQMNGQNLVLNPNDTCGKDVTGGTTIPNGQFYADLLDNNNNGAQVGRCVFEQGGNEQDCSADGSQEADTSVHCYTNALN